VSHLVRGGAHGGGPARVLGGVCCPGGLCDGVNGVWRRNRPRLVPPSAASHTVRGVAHCAGGRTPSAVVHPVVGRRACWAGC